MKISIHFDEKRCGYFVIGLGFDFFAYFTGDELQTTGIECDFVKREGDDFELYLIIDLRGARMLSHDLFETMVLSELQKYWCIEK